MVSGSTAVIFLLIAVALVVLATGRWKVNAFSVLIAVSFAYGLAIGMPSLDVVKAVRDGFGGTLTYIGIVIVAGTIMGYILEKTGAALVMTRAILGVVGQKQAPLAMNIAGYIVSIPVFCDSGYVILTPLNRALAAALTAFRRAAEADPTDFAALNNIGGILLNAHHEPAGAARAFERALELQDLPMVRKNLARVRTLAQGGRS